MACADGGEGSRAVSLLTEMSSSVAAAAAEENAERLKEARKGSASSSPPGAGGGGTMVRGALHIARWGFIVVVGRRERCMLSLSGRPFGQVKIMRGLKKNGTSQQSFFRLLSLVIMMLCSRWLLVVGICFCL